MEPIKKQLETKTYLHLGSEGEGWPSTSTEKGNPAKLMKTAVKVGRYAEQNYGGMTYDAAESRVPGGAWRDVDTAKGRRDIAGDLGLPNKKKSGKTSNPKRFYNPYEAASPRNPYNRK